HPALDGAGFDGLVRVAGGGQQRDERRKPHGTRCGYLGAPAITTPIAFRSGGSTPSRWCTKKSQRFRSPYSPPDVWSAPGMTSRSNDFFALMSAFTTCMVDD